MILGILELQREFLSLKNVKQNMKIRVNWTEEYAVKLGA